MSSTLSSPKTRPDALSPSLRNPSRRILAVVAALAWIVAGAGAAPGGVQGDDCASPLSAQLGDNAFDTSEFTNSALPVDGGDCGDIGALGQDIWFSHTFVSDGLVKVSTCDPDSFFTGLMVYDATGGCGSLDFVVSSGFVDFDEDCQGGHSENYFVATAGTEYLIRVGGADPDEGGPGTLNLSFTPQPNPCDCDPGDSQCPTEFVAVNAFPIPGSIEMATDGIYAIWWDGDFDHAADTQAMFSRLNQVRANSLNQLGMKDPPNPGQCLYYNVYIHQGPDDEFPNGWANGQGTDPYCRPYLTLPVGAHLDENNLDHEGFHIFQYSADSPGLVPEDAGWYIESSAQWYAATQIPGEDNAFIEAGAIIGNPHLALWHSFSNEAPGDPLDWLHQVRQYGLHTLLFYLTDIRGVESSFLTELFYNGTPRTPQEELSFRIGAPAYRRLFADWAAENTAGLIYLTPGQVERALAEVENVGDPNNFNPYVADVTASDLEGGWTFTPCPELPCHRPRSWAYNAIRIANETSGAFTFQLVGDLLGSDGALSRFEGRVVLMEPDGPRIESMTRTGGQNFTHTTFVDADVSEVFVVVVTTPEHYLGNQTYGYTLQGGFDPNAVPSMIFQDGFESGDTARWSVTQ
ncbi:MAG: hypothetical protein AAGM22_18100 [Acidobacteriota bacterium]